MIMETTHRIIYEDSSSLSGIENKSIYKVITPRVVKWNENDKSKRWVENDKQLHEWHFVDKSFKDLPKELTKNATEINKVTITDSQYKRHRTL